MIFTSHRFLWYDLLRKSNGDSLLSRNKMITSGVLLSLLLLTSTGTAQITVDAVRRLTGGKSRTWQFKQTITFLSEGDRCSGSGERWTFKKDQTVQIESCVEGKFQRQTKRWGIRQISRLDLELTVDHDKYALVLPDVEANKSQQIILRISARKKGAVTKDKLFTYKPD